MPLYDYRCPLCDSYFGENRSIMQKEEIKQCENCKVDYVRVFNTPAITFSGSGFYANDKKEK